ncbi:MAG: B12-binding domain-containing radical SAM protein [Candidatus Omnitrophica bacterium]|nr:B12-binding domain-containing radical SAM protein [Candidatus Omnitrophota bacterium]
MKILLLSMPDAIPLFYSYKSYVPNLGIRSIAANIDMKGAEVKCLDMIFFYKNILPVLKRASRDFAPDIVGISAMTFQYDTALKIARIIKGLNKSVKIVLGGYHATLMYDEIANEENTLFDYIIRNEGEKSFCELVQAIEGGGGGLAGIKGLSFRKGKDFVHNEKSDLVNLDELTPPRRDAQLFDFPPQVFGRVEAIEASRGCTMGCDFCSIDRMYGRRFRKYGVDRVIDDIKAAKRMRANRIFFVDDNITLDARHFEGICEAIAKEGLNDLFYAAQVSSAGIASSEQLVQKMRAANFGIVFLGIENTSRDRLNYLGKGDITEATRRAIGYLRKNDIGIMGGFIVGNPDDSIKDIRACFEFAKKAKVDLLMASYLMPYPKTAIREKLLNMGLVEYERDYARYNGFQPVARTRYLTMRQLEKNVVKFNITWYLGEIFNPRNWFAKSKRVFRRVYIRGVIYTLCMIVDFARGRYGKSPHRI